MLKITKPFPGERPSAQTISQIIDAINSLSQISVGPGLNLTQGASGITISLAGNQAKTTPGYTKGNTNNPTEIAATQNSQDTDTWELDTATAPITLKIMTEVYYDATTTHKIFCRYRTITIDTNGCIRSISAESDPVEITEAVACTAT